MERYTDIIIELARKSLVTKDIPVGAIVVYNNKIIGEGYNTREKDQNILGHAEISAINAASKYLNNWNLSDCEMYVTLKPCQMCAEIIKQSRIKNIYYLLEKPDYKKDFSNCEFKLINNSLESSKYAEILSEFFKELRAKK